MDSVMYSLIRSRMADANSDLFSSSECVSTPRRIDSIVRNLAETRSTSVGTQNCS